ncbi:hypothetical protein [Ketobacter sp.]|nr:MAG: hypothetical protein D6160_03360 [Ketobacter sp.]
MKDGIIAEIHCETIKGQPAELLQFHNGLVIAITTDTLCCYKSLQSIGDPLGNGLLSFCAIPAEQSILFNDNRCVSEHRSGYVGLTDGKALLIAPFHVRLYPNNHDALRGLNCLAELELPEIDVY